jgi:hypothetical protein
MEQHFDRGSLGHRLVAGRGLGERQLEVEDRAG